MRVAIVIPARYQSSRFPGKPFAPIRGIPLLERVYSLAAAVEGVDSVSVATDDERILDQVSGFGGRAVMTPAECRNGTERIHAALPKLGFRPDVVVNFQGDAVLTPPWIIQPLVDLMRSTPEVLMSTPAVAMTEEEVRFAESESRAGKTGGTMVVFDKNRKALYFSKSVIPHLRTRRPGVLPFHRHIGMYAYRTDLLERYVTLPMGPLEQCEELEQLRALEHGIPIDVVLVDYRGRSHGSIDNPSDVDRVEAIIDREGELLPTFSNRKGA